MDEDDHQRRHQTCLFVSPYSALLPVNITRPKKQATAVSAVLSSMEMIVLHVMWLMAR